MRGSGSYSWAQASLFACIAIYGPPGKAIFSTDGGRPLVFWALDCSPCRFSVSIRMIRFPAGGHCCPPWELLSRLPRASLHGAIAISCPASQRSLSVLLATHFIYG